MEHSDKMILELARPETLPDLPRKVRLLAKLYGRQKIAE